MTVRFLDQDEVDQRSAAGLRGGESLANTVAKPRWVQLMEGESDLVVLAASLLRAVNDKHALSGEASRTRGRGRRPLGRR